MSISIQCLHRSGCFPNHSVPSDKRFGPAYGVLGTLTRTKTVPMSRTNCLDILRYCWLRTYMLTDPCSVNRESLSACPRYVQITRGGVTQSVEFFKTVTKNSSVYSWVCTTSLTSKIALFWTFQLRDKHTAMFHVLFIRLQDVLLGENNQWKILEAMYSVTNLKKNVFKTRLSKMKTDQSEFHNLQRKDKSTGNCRNSISGFYVKFQ